jgi:predicted ATP-grasp superfamily ATP-dependent carboligase
VPDRETKVVANQTKKIGAVIIGGHFQGLGILRSLARRNVPTYLLDHELCIGRFSRYSQKFIKCPSAEQESILLKFLTDLAQRDKLDRWLIYPNDDETVRFLASNKQQLEEHYRVATPSWEVVKLAYDKRLTYQLAERCGILVPKTSYARNIKELEQLDIRFPVVIKPAIKEPFFRLTRKKAIRVDNHQQLVQEFAKATSLVDGSGLMIQELIPGGPNHLFSVGSLYKNGEFLGKVVAKRLRQHPMDFGHATTFAITVDIPELEEITKKILLEMGYYGLSEVEFMLDPRDGNYKLIEINARPWGWHTLAIGAGVDLPYLQYQDMLGETTKKDGFDKDVKWIRLITDTPVALTEIIKGRMKITDYLNSFRGKKQFSVLSISDPLPFIAEILMIPYLRVKRGF